MIDGSVQCESISRLLALEMNEIEEDLTTSCAFDCVCVCTLKTGEFDLEQCLIGQTLLALFCLVKS